MDLVVLPLPSIQHARCSSPSLYPNSASQGLAERTVLLRHALKNAAIPLVTIVALDLPTIVNGALYTEIIFSWPGMGQLFFRAAVRRDYPILMAMTMLSSVMIILANLLADIAYAYLDPRVRYERSGK